MPTHTSKNPVATLLGALGPGLLMAGAAIGVSHLVQSTRAGADFGFQLIVVVLLINLLKYPFFEYGHRYPVATGENLLDGYRKMGSGFLWAFLGLAVVSAIASTAGVTFVTAGLLLYFFGTTLSPQIWSVIIMAVCVGLLAGGQYKRLDGAMKVIMVVLVLATVTAFVAAALHGSVAAPGFVSPSPWTGAALPFLIALMGWMPAPIEISVFQSLWMQARDRERGRRTTAENAWLDFNFSYGLTIVMALFFLGLGALVLHGSGLTLQGSAGGFANQLIQVYQDVLGSWAGPVIAAAAFTTMFSTTLTVIDGYPRALAEGVHLVLPRLGGAGRLYPIWIGIVCIAALVLILAFVTSLTGLIDLVTTMAFLSAPVYAYLNYRLLTSAHTPDEFRPGPAMRVLSRLGILFFIGISLLFVYVRFG